MPPDLVHVSEAGTAGGGSIREVAIDDLRAMAEAAAAAGNPIGVWSPYRSYEEQVQIYNNYVALDGVEGASTHSMPPGHSEHQLGLGVDFMSAGGGNPLIGDWRTTPAGKWMSENAWKFGWVMSYPLDPDWQEGDQPLVGQDLLLVRTVALPLPGARDRCHSPRVGADHSRVPMAELHHGGSRHR